MGEVPEGQDSGPQRPYKTLSVRKENYSTVSAEGKGNGRPRDRDTDLTRNLQHGN